MLVYYFIMKPQREENLQAIVGYPALSARVSTLSAHPPVAPKKAIRGFVEVIL
jgi:hypothetical protein